LLLLYRKFHYDISMYICIISQLGSSPSLFFPFYLSLLIVISTGLKIHSCIKSLSAIFTFFFILPSSCMWLPLSQTCFT
jgi:hypothetical protein